MLPLTTWNPSMLISCIGVGYLERGERRPSMETFIAIVGALSVSADDILADYLTIPLNTITNDSCSQAWC